MNITIGYDFLKNKFMQNDEKNINNNEKIILEKIIDMLKGDFEISNFKIIAKSDAYLTLTYMKRDIVRLKYTNNTKWISIFIMPKYKKDYENEPIFEAQKNKNQLFWKSKITDDNIGKYIDYINIACTEIQKQI